MVLPTLAALICVLCCAVAPDGVVTEVNCEAEEGKPGCDEKVDVDIGEP